MVTRRQFVTGTLAAGTLSLLPFRFGLPVLNSALADDLLSDSPIRSLRAGDASTSKFTGDEIERTHSILWDIANYVRSRGGWPQPSEHAPVVVVGGGVAGLSAAFALRDLNPIILEQDSSFGGNAKGEKFGNNLYSIGSAYITAPSRDSNLGTLLRALGLERAVRAEDADHTTVFMKDRFAKGFWHGATDPTAKDHFERVYRRLQQLNGNIPQSRSLDEMSFAQWLSQEFGNVHPHLLEYFQLYCWSSFCASIEEISAYQMLGFISAETGTLLALPGGNAFITATIHKRLISELGRNRVRSQCLVINVKREAGKVIVTSVAPDGSLFAISADKVVFAAPKFVAKHLISDLSDDQRKAMGKIKYRGYVVANVILDRAINSPCYELYCLENEVPEMPSAMHQSTRPFSDLVFGSWAQGDSGTNSVLTIYKSFAFDGDKQFLFHPDAHDKYRDRVLAGLPKVLEPLNINPRDVRGVRMTRWGHSLPIATQGMLSSGLAARASAPIENQIFFANQDNMVNPSFETALDSALEAAASIRAQIRT